MGDASEGGEVVMREVQRCWKEPRDDGRHTIEEGRGARRVGGHRKYHRGL